MYHEYNYFTITICPFVQQPGSYIQWKPALYTSLQQEHRLNHTSYLFSLCVSLSHTHTRTHIHTDTHTNTPGSCNWVCQAGLGWWRMDSGVERRALSISSLSVCNHSWRGHHLPPRQRASQHPGPCSVALSVPAWPDKPIPLTDKTQKPQKSRTRYGGYRKIIHANSFQT